MGLGTGVKNSVLRNSAYQRQSTMEEELNNQTKRPGQLTSASVIMGYSSNGIF